MRHGPKVVLVSCDWRREREQNMQDIATYSLKESSLSNTNHCL